MWRLKAKFSLNIYLDIVTAKGCKSFLFLMCPWLLAYLFIRFPAVPSIGGSKFFSPLAVFFYQSEGRLQNMVVQQLHIIVQKH